MSTGYEAVIGLEVHAQLQTASKLFCGCSTRFGVGPNENVCPVCLGLPGALPVLNRRAVMLAVRAALAFGLTVHDESVFARKQYFYPDLPKGYQISQFEQPFSSGGQVQIEVDGKILVRRITRIHMEEDAGKSIHGLAGGSVVDLNRAGVPLTEIVGEPDLRSSAEAVAYLKEVRDTLVFIGANDGNLEEGSFRCDANVSIRPVGSTTLGTRTELKNLNSFRFVQRAIDEEIARQTTVLLGGGQITQETRGFDADAGKSYPMRSKEESHDYRYFPDPDLPPLVITPEIHEAARAGLGELPGALRERWESELGLSEQAARTLSAHPAYADFFHEALDLSRGKHAVRLSNWIQTEVLRGARTRGLEAEFPVTPAQIAELVGLVETGKINGKQAKAVYASLEGTEKRPAEVVSELGMASLGESAVREIVEQVVSESPAQVAQYRGGKTGVLGFFVGQVMKRTRGAANPKRVNELLLELLGRE